MTISTEQLLFDADTLHSNNFFKTDAFLTKVLFKKRYFFTRAYDTYIIIVLLV